MLDKQIIDSMWNAFVDGRSFDQWCDSYCFETGQRRLCYWVFYAWEFYDRKCEESYEPSRDSKTL